MCELNELTKLTSKIATTLIFILPSIYLLIYFFNKKIPKKRKKQNALKVMFYAFLFGLLLFGIKNMFRLKIDKFKCINCAVNLVCENKEEETFKEETTTQEIVTTSTTTAIVESTTKSQNNEDVTYPNVKQIDGIRRDIGKSKKGYTIYQIDGVTYVDEYLIANKSYFLPEDYVPKNTYTDASDKNTQQCSTCIENTAYKAWKEMKADAKAIGLNIYISSGYRAYNVQKNIYNRNVKNRGKEQADTFSARPGSSEHQTGLCFDLNTIDSSFQFTDEGKWVDSHAHLYGYIIRYPKGKTDETGYIYEPWHLRYVGTELATKLYNNGNWLSMEDYFGLTSTYSED